MGNYQKILLSKSITPKQAFDVIDDFMSTNYPNISKTERDGKFMDVHLGSEDESGIHFFIEASKTKYLKLSSKMAPGFIPFLAQLQIMYSVPIYFKDDKAKDINEGTQPEFEWIKDVKNKFLNIEDYFKNKKSENAFDTIGKWVNRKILRNQYPYLRKSVVYKQL